MPHGGELKKANSVSGGIMNGNRVLLVSAALGLCALAAVLALVAASPAARGGDEKRKVPVGMEEINIGRIKMIVPKGMKTTKHRSLVTLEDPNEYLARRLQEMADRIKKIEKAVARIEKAALEQRALTKHNIENLTLDIEDIKKALPKKKK
jgi:predicted RNase H-like nuclease (RuvC/YqgF family)